MFTSIISTNDLVTVRDSITRPADTTQYAADDVVSDATGDAHYSWKWTATQIKSPFTGLIQTARCYSSANAATKPNFDLLLFHTDIAAVADNSPLNVSDAESLTMIGLISFPTASWKDFNNNSGCFVDGLSIPFTAPTSTIYGQLVERSTYTPANAEIITVDLVIARDSG